MSKKTIHTPRAATSLVHQPRRRQEWTGLSTQEILARHRIGKTPPLKVLELLIDLFNQQHTARHKEVSFKTRRERADFLRRFFRDLKHKAGFKTLPDPRNLGERHIKAMVAVWQKEQLAAATLQTYLSFLRGLAQWLGKHGLVRPPQHYGLQPDQYQRHEASERDKSWSAQQIVRRPVWVYTDGCGCTLQFLGWYRPKRSIGCCQRTDSGSGFRTSRLLGRLEMGTCCRRTHIA